MDLEKENESPPSEVVVNIHGEEEEEEERMGTYAAFCFRALTCLLTFVYVSADEDDAEEKRLRLRLSWQRVDEISNFHFPASNINNQR